MSLRYQTEKLALTQQTILDHLLKRLKDLENEVKMYRRVVLGGGISQSHADSRYVNVTGDIMTGDLDLDTHDLLWDTLRLGKKTDNALEVTNLAGTTHKHWYVNTLYLNSMYAQVTTGNFYARNVANSKFEFQGFKSGTDWDVVARIQSHATAPCFEIFLGGDITQLADKKFVAQESAELTISGGVITVTGCNNVVDTEGDAATDDLDTINGGEDGMIITLRAADSARTVTVKHLTVPAGNIMCGIDFSLNNAADTITLIYDAGDTVWLRIARADNA